MAPPALHARTLMLIDKLLMNLTGVDALRGLSLLLVLVLVPRVFTGIFGSVPFSKTNIIF